MSEQPDITPKIKPYLTDIATRRPRQKLHGTLHHAKAAVVNATWGYGHNAKTPCGISLWEWRDGAWHSVYEIAQGTLRDDLPWKKEGK